MTSEFPSPKPNLTVGAARDFGTRLVRTDSLVPVRDALADSVFQGHSVHIPVEENRIVQPADQAKFESINSSEAEAEQVEGEMVIQRIMIVDRFLPGRLPTMQQQTQGRDQPPPTTHTWKRQCTTD